ncbi:serine hydrolase domain-containing protein [Spirosoma spitsbergense]|uniref:serine hydrolase domain-containing protein n=1 Tax=Spirosoma spitsbergense TaxID=431554 RepID=UPI0003785ABF|nr:serine hydrolase domain-containing protein [Spirosoma spitsbergense]
MNTKQTARTLALVWLMITACAQEPIAPVTDSVTASNPWQRHLRNDMYRQALQMFNQRWKQPGTTLLLKRANEPVWMGAVGKSNLELQTNLRTTDPFRAASITKTFVAIAVMKLQEQGELQLDNTLGMLLPDMVGRVAGADRITLRQMLSHTSGLFDPTNDGVQYQLDLLNDPALRLAMSTQQVLARYVYGRPLRFEPGEQFGYSNTNYWLLGMVIEKITGQPLQSVLDTVIFKPAGLTHTYLESRDDRDVVRGYTDFYNNGKLMDITALDRADSQGRASGGLITTIEDLFRFSEALFRGTLIRKASLTAMMTLQPVRRGTTEYGLGLDSYASPLGVAWGHNGTLLGVDANWFYFPDKQATYILFGNNGSGADKSFIHELLTS